MLRVGGGRGIFARSIGSAAAPAPAFSPLSLFEAGEFGWYFDPSSPDNMFQLSTGSTAVTAYTQPIGYLTDLSGNGQHFTQATDANRPLWAADGDYSRIDGNGTNSYISKSVTMPAGKRKLTIGTAFKADSVANDFYLVVGSTTLAGGFLVKFLASTKRLVIRLGANDLAIPIAITADTPYVLTASLDADGSAVTGRLNETDFTLGGVSTVDFASGTNAILAGSPSAQRMNGGVNGHIVRFAESTADELAGMRAWLNARIGAY